MAACLAGLVLGGTLGPGRAGAAADGLRYRLSFAGAAQRVMDVELLVPSGTGTLELVMSRSSPGRYGLHEFSKNLFDVRASDGSGRPVPLERPAPHRWVARVHEGTIRVQYRVYGDRVDGTYLAVDATHAHVNVPAALLWVRGLERRPATVILEPPPDARWRVATQLFPTADPFTFTAPNLAYLMDSPIEASRHAVEAFRAPALPGAAQGPLMTLALHTTRGEDADAAAYIEPLRRVVAEAAAVFGEYPAFDAGQYTFIADFLPWASGDGMEHRNSTVLTGGASPEQADRIMLGTAAHEFFHAWNVERIRPRSLEPFDLEAANVSGELWLAEGVTSYYETLLACRAGLATLPQTLQEWTHVVNQVLSTPARGFHSAEEMSRMAVFTDGPPPLDRTNWHYSYLTYYVHGAALGLALDLSLRAQTGGVRSLDDFMRTMWTRHGRPGGDPVGTIAVPYTLDDVRARLEEVAGDATFARAFIARYVQGREAPDYAALLAPAGLRARALSPGRATLGLLPLEKYGARVRIAGPVAPAAPLSEAGLGEDDEIVGVEGRDAATPEEIEAVLQQGRPGDRLALRIRRRGESDPRTVHVRLVEDPRIAIVTAESLGETPTAAERAFRDSWLRGRSGARDRADFGIGLRKVTPR